MVLVFELGDTFYIESFSNTFTAIAASASAEFDFSLEREGILLGYFFGYSQNTANNGRQRTVNLTNQVGGAIGSATLGVNIVQDLRLRFTNNDAVNTNTCHVFVTLLLKRPIRR